jgi:hypothetical protein
MSLTTTFDLYIASQRKSLIATEPLSSKYEMDQIKTGTEDRHSGQIFKWNSIQIRSAQFNNAIFRIVMIHDPIRQKPGDGDAIRRSKF